MKEHAIRSNAPDWIEGLTTSFVMHCDENGLTLQEGLDLAERIGDELGSAAEDRISYLPSEMVEANHD